MAGLNPVGSSGPADVARLIAAVRAPGEAVPTPFRGNAPQQVRTPPPIFFGKLEEFFFKDLNTNQKSSILIHFQCDNLELRIKICLHYFL